MLKFTNVELELFTNYDKYLFIKNRIRSGITSYVNRYAKANNPYLETDYNEKLPNSYLIYIDCNNNLYGFSVGKAMANGYKWGENLKIFDIMSVTDDSSIGYILPIQ